MSTPRIHVRSFNLRYYEMDSWGQATPLTILNLLEEAAFTHCDVSGWDIYRLRRNGFGWVLLRGSVQMTRYPCHRESFTVETWMSKARAFYGEREYLIRDSAGEVLCAARSLWIFYSLERKRPIPVLPEIVSAWAPEGTRSTEQDLVDVVSPGPEWIDLTRMYDVRGSDIDTNGHVNNVNYLEWALESVPREVHDGFQLMRVDGQYRKEVYYGERVSPALESLSHDGSPSFAHGVFARRADSGKLEAVAAARTAWMPRPAGV
jgi:acyl-ACP thioesterase